MDGVSFQRRPLALLLYVLLKEGLVAADRLELIVEGIESMPSAVAMNRPDLFELGDYAVRIADRIENIGVAA